MFVFLEQLFYHLLGWLPFIIVVILWAYIMERYSLWRSESFHMKKERVVLEIRIPQEINKTPLAMEMVLQSFFNPLRKSDFVKRKFYGSLFVPQFSLEIASNGGVVRFYVRTEKEFVEHVRSAFQAHYPTVELIEVPDYAQFVPFDPDREYLAGGEYRKTEADCRLIRLYNTHFELDKLGPKSEEIHDPFSLVLETLGSIEPGDHMWLQYIFKANIGDHLRAGKQKLSLIGRIRANLQYGRWEGGKVDLDKQAKQVYAKIFAEQGQIIAGTKFNRLNKDEEQTLTEIQDGLSKASFWVTIRSVYKTDKAENAEKHAGKLAPIFAPVGRGSNSIWMFYKTGFNFWWDDLTGNRIKKERKELFYDYKNRRIRDIPKRPWTLWLYDKSKYKTMRLNIMELATIFHLPFEPTATTPSLDRTRFRKGGAPTDLPF